ncbi:MTH895/ArsE family thioredoxin-like protein [Candidatus Caldatribacterium saccharofermentans]|uniref:Thioredoxin family protein n=2 Tax=Candidatus Caldatribacterium TaxID=1454725 RepID=A0A7V4TZ22_9BACT
MNIAVFGMGCPKCKATEHNVREACRALGIDAEVTHVADPREFAKMGVRMTPAVVVDGTVLFSGKVPTVEELKEALQKLRS